MKTNWPKVNAARVRQGQFATDDSYGFAGAFAFTINGLPIRVICSDGEGWCHVSVSVTGSELPPSWSVMCQIKDLFFGNDEWVIQFHPPESEYVNNHPGCLHLWKPTEGSFPTPDSILVGYKFMNLKREVPQQ